MNPQQSENVTNKLVFWILSVLGIVITTFAAATANRIITQIDDVALRLGRIEADMSAAQIYRIDMERRLDIIEQRLYKDKR